jgi:hypothetical protein
MGNKISRFDKVESEYKLIYKIKSKLYQNHFSKLNLHELPELIKRNIKPNKEFENIFDKLLLLANSYLNSYLKTNTNTNSYDDILFQYNIFIMILKHITSYYTNRAVLKHGDYYYCDCLHKKNISEIYKCTFFNDSHYDIIESLRDNINFRYILVKRYISIKGNKLYEDCILAYLKKNTNKDMYKDCKSIPSAPRTSIATSDPTD